MAGEMAEQFTAQIAGDANESMAGDPAGQAPQHVVGGDQHHQKGEGDPDRALARTGRQRIDEKLYAVLRTDRAADGAQHGNQDRRMRQLSPTNIPEEERDRSPGVITETGNGVNVTPDVGSRLHREWLIRCDKKGTAAQPPHLAPI